MGNLFEVVRASLIAVKTPISYWGKAITSTAYLINQVPSSSINFQTPLQALTNGRSCPNCSKSTSSCFWGSTIRKFRLSIMIIISQRMMNLGQSELGTRKRVQEALGDPRWKAAMNEEMKSLQKNETWELVELSTRKEASWVSLDLYCEVTRQMVVLNDLKPRLVVKGYTQTYGIDYTETFAPVAKINTVRMHGVRKAMSEGVQIEEVMYGLKQSSRAWLEGGNLVTWKVRSRMSSLVQVQKQNLEVTYLGNQSDCFVTIKLHVTLLIIQYNMIITKHVEVDRFFIKEKLDDKIVELPKIRSEDQLADILTQSYLKSSVLKIFRQVGHV
ncbi:hypothetical protein CK203_094773 [Vitis vinifera]|uniref:Retrovirus-related Pol polyprotein from transposon TNT 1-94 n=1 Tax=Vitis vinifera TaxID=29760 RepID=A0A438D0I2_VITVI|nr:hypothetical protein CK203_094773 [Vitis vinifera]